MWLVVSGEEVHSHTDKYTHIHTGCGNERGTKAFREENKHNLYILLYNCIIISFSFFSHGSLVFVHDGHG